MAISFLSTIHDETYLSGDTMLFALSKDARYRAVTSSDLTGYGLYNKISSSRVYASSEVDATAIFFGSPKDFSGLPAQDFSGSFVQLTNQEGSGSPQDINKFSDFSFDNKAQSMILVGPNKSGLEFRLSFRDLFLDLWNGLLKKAIAGSQAEQKGDPIMTWEMWPQGISHLDPGLQYLKIHQNLNIAIDWWPDYDASITYHIYLYLDDSGRLSGFAPRWGYWIEGGIKTSHIDDKLKPKVIAGFNELNVQLKNQFAGFTTKFKDLYYLPGSQPIRPGSGIVQGSTTDDTTIVLVI